MEQTIPTSRTLLLDGPTSARLVAGNKFLGIGVLREISLAQRVFEVQTAVLAEPAEFCLVKNFKFRIVS